MPRPRGNTDSWSSTPTVRTLIAEVPSIASFAAREASRADNQVHRLSLDDRHHIARTLREAAAKAEKSSAGAVSMVASAGTDPPATEKRRCRRHPARSFRNSRSPLWPIQHVDGSTSTSDLGAPIDGASDTETAATKIQAAYRGRSVRSNRRLRKSTVDCRTCAPEIVAKSETRRTKTGAVDHGFSPCTDYPGGDDITDIGLAAIKSQLASARQFLEGYRAQVVREQQVKDEYKSGPVQASLKTLERRVQELQKEMDTGQREERALRAELATIEAARMQSNKSNDVQGNDDGAALTTTKRQRRQAHTQPRTGVRLQPGLSAVRVLEDSVAQQGKMLRQKLMAERKLKGQLKTAQSEKQSMVAAVDRIQRALAAAEQEGQRLAQAVSMQQKELRIARKTSKKQEKVLKHRDAQLEELEAKLQAISVAIESDSENDQILQEQAATIRTEMKEQLCSAKEAQLQTEKAVKEAADAKAALAVEQAEKAKLLAMLDGRNALAIEAAKLAVESNEKARRAEEALEDQKSADAELRELAQQASIERDFWRHQAETSPQSGKFSCDDNVSSAKAEAAANALAQTKAREESAKNSGQIRGVESTDHIRIATYDAPERKKCPKKSSVIVHVYRSCPLMFTPTTY